MEKYDLLSAIDFEINDIRHSEGSSGVNTWITLSSIAAVGWLLTNIFFDNLISTNDLGKCVLYSALVVSLFSGIKAELSSIFEVKTPRTSGLFSLKDLFQKSRNIFAAHLSFWLLLTFLSVHFYDANKWQTKLAIGCFVIVDLVLISLILLSYSNFHIPTDSNKTFVIKKKSLVPEKPRGILNKFLKIFYLTVNRIIVLQVMIAGLPTYFFMREVYLSLRNDKTFVTVSALMMVLIYLFQKYLTVLSKHPFIEEYTILRRELSLGRVTAKATFDAFYRIRYGKTSQDILEKEITELISYITDIQTKFDILLADNIEDSSVNFEKVIKEKFDKIETSKVSDPSSLYDV